MKITRRQLVLRVLTPAVVIALSTAGSYSFTRAIRAKPAKGPPVSRDSILSHMFATGRYLVAYVLVSSECGFCAERHTKESLGELRDSLIASHHDSFDKISVIGVAIDEDIRQGFNYLESLGPPKKVFDELTIGNSWLNHFVSVLVWRDGVAEPLVPQVIVAERNVDASGYPRYVDVGTDSVVRVVSGRDSLIAWVAAGTPLPQ